MIKVEFINTKSISIIKNILLIDDSITLGQSIRNAIFAITQAYVPKSISILTMFSKLYYDIDDKYCPYNGTYYEDWFLISVFKKTKINKKINKITDKHYKLWIVYLDI